MPSFLPVIEPPSGVGTELDDTPPVLPPVAVDDGTVSTDPDRWQLAVATIGNREWKGELLQARIESYSQMWDGGGTISATVPTTDISWTHALGSNPVTWNGKRLTNLDDAVDRCLVPIRNGLVGPSYPIRDAITVKAGTIPLSGQQMERLFAERIVGTAERFDYLSARGSFEFGTSMSAIGFYKVGTVDADIQTSGAAHGNNYLRIRGNRDDGHVIAQCTITSTSTTGTSRVPVRASALVKLPSDALDDYTVMDVTVARVGADSDYWPEPGKGNSGAANVDGDMIRGDWLTDPLSAVALLPPPTYSVVVTVHLYPQSEDEWTGFDDVEIFRRDSLGTATAKDLVYHQRTLINDAQHGTGKASWGLTPAIGDLTGVEEIGVWRHEDDQPLTDALDALAGRYDGPENVWIDPNLTAWCSATRGTVRTDIAIGPDDILNPDGWTTDPGNVATTMRGMTDRGSDYWRIEIERRATPTFAGGQVIERYSRAPNGMSLNAVDNWTQAELARHAQPQDTIRVLVRGALGYPIQLGDTVTVTQIDGHAYLSKPMRCYGKTILPPVGLVALDFGANDV